MRIQQSEVILQFSGSNADSAPVLGDLQPGKLNSLRGTPDQWRTNVDLYGAVVYPSIYPGIDAHFTSSGRLLKSEFFVRAGANPDLIRLHYGSVDHVEVNATGELLLHTSTGVLREQTPEVYQISRDGSRQMIPAMYVLTPRSEIGFAIGEYDHGRDLIIDPLMTYSTYFGGTGIDIATSVTADGSGNMYMAGYTTRLICQSRPPSSRRQDTELTASLRSSVLSATNLFTLPIWAAVWMIGYLGWRSILAAT